VFLLLALIFGVLALLQTRVSHTNHGTVVSPPENFTFVLLSVGGLVFLLALELADRVTMKRDLEIAREIQRWLVPEKPPRVAGVDLAFASRPANTVGGDYYDAFLRRAPAGERLLLVVADVAGKSVPAALLMATFQASLRTLAGAPTSLDELVAGLNRYACQHSLGGTRFTTAFFAELDPATRELCYVRAGHNEPILRRASAGVERLAAGNLPLGIAADALFSASIVRLAPGDLLVIFTDGLVEAVNAQDEMFGEDRALDALAAAPAAGAEQALKNLMAAVDAFVGPTRQHDDITLLVARAV
jgi:sigma-B regulation protein RsbU (phosphoserine phosphatase)